MVGMGGGSDAIQAAMVGKLLSEKYGVTNNVLISIRNEAHGIENTGVSFGIATKEITPETKPVGNWRFLEDIPSEDEEVYPLTFLLSSTDPQIIKSDIEELVTAFQADVIIGLDTGGDSLYRATGNEVPMNATNTSPDQDQQALEGLALLAQDQSNNVHVLSMVVAPGIDSPPYAQDVLKEASASRIPLNDDDVAAITSQYAKWRMDGSGKNEGRYGKTPLAWLHALEGHTGLQVLNLPSKNVTSTSNPWRTFVTVEPSMADIVIMEAKKHYAVTKRSH